MLNIKKKLEPIPKFFLVLILATLACSSFYILFGVPIFIANLTNTGKPGMLFFISLQLTLLQLFHLKKAYASTNWPTTKGTITQSKIVEGHEHDGQFKPQITYEYTIDGEIYINWAESPKQKFEDMGRIRAEKIVAEHPVGSNITVYYQKDNPSNSYREVGVSKTNWILLLFFLMGTVSTGFWVAAIWPGFEPERLKNIADQIPAFLPFDDIKDISTI